MNWHQHLGQWALVCSIIIAALWMATIARVRLWRFSCRAADRMNRKAAK